MKFLHAFILALAGSVALGLAVLAGHASLTAYQARELAALPAGLLSVLLGCAAIHLYAGTFAALSE